MSIPAPNTVPPLPVAAGFETLLPGEKVDALWQLRASSATDPYVLQGTAWSILADSFYERRLPDSRLLNEVESTLETIVERKADLPANDPALYFDTRLTLATFDAFRAQQGKGLLSMRGHTRYQIARNAGGIVGEIAAPVNFDLDKLPVRTANKALDAMVIGMCALRQRWPFPVAVPAMPTLHKLQRIDSGTNTSAFSLYLLRKDENDRRKELRLPLSVERDTESKMHDPTWRRGVVQIPMKSLLWNTSRGVHSIREDQQTQDTMTIARNSLLNHTARYLALYGATREMPNDYMLLLDLAARYVGLRAQDYDPNGLNALAKKPAR